MFTRFRLGLCIMIGRTDPGFRIFVSPNFFKTVVQMTLNPSRKRENEVRTTDLKRFNKTTLPSDGP